METVAVYREKPVRTYGVRAKGGLVLARLACPPQGLAGLSAALSAAQPPLELAACGMSRGASPELNLCLPAGQCGLLAELVSRAGGRLAGRQEVDLISLQGPHFGDRWGIAHQALAGLAEAGVRPRLVLGVLHTLQLLVDPAESSRALQGLRTRFASPEDGHA